MLKLIKNTLLWISLVLFVVIIAAIALLFFVDPNNFKDKISSTVSEQTGREITIGNIGWTFFPNLALTLSNVTVSNQATFDAQYFAFIKQAEVGIKAAPLFKKTIETNKVAINGLQLNLEEKLNGSNNWDNVFGGGTHKNTSKAISSNTLSSTNPAVSSATPNKDSAEPHQALKLEINGIDIRNATIDWKKAKTEQHAVANFKKLQLGKVNDKNTPFKVNSQFNIESNNPALDANLNIEAKAQIAPRAEKISFNNLNISGTLQDVTPTKGRLNIAATSDVVIDTQQEQFTINELKLKTNGATAEGFIKGDFNGMVKGSLDVAPFNLKKFLLPLGIKLITPAENSLTSIKGSVSLEKKKNKLSIAILNSAIDNNQMTGELVVNNDSDINFNLTFDQLNADNYYPATINMVVPTSKLPAEKTASSASKTKQKKMPKKSASSKPQTGNATKAPDLSRYKASGEIRIGKLTVANLHAENVQSQLSSKNGIIKFGPSSAKLYQGQQKGLITVNTQQTTPRFDLNENLSGIQMQPLLIDLADIQAISGTGELSLQLSAKGEDSDSIKHSLSGQARFSIDNGFIKGLNLTSLVNNAYNKVKRKAKGIDDASNQTTFSKLTGTVNITEGIARNDDLRLASPIFLVTGSGKVDLVSEKISYNIEVGINPESGSPLADFVELAGNSIPFKVRGTISHPTFEANLPIILKRITEKRLGKTFKGVGDQFDDLNDKLEKSSKDLGKQLKSLFDN